jgi:hypothetical protein
MPRERGSCYLPDLAFHQMRPGANSTIFRFGLEDFTPPGISSQKKNVDAQQRKPLLLFLLLGLFLLRTPQPTPGYRVPDGARQPVLSLPLIFIISQHI